MRCSTSGSFGSVRKVTGGTPAAGGWRGITPCESSLWCVPGQTESNVASVSPNRIWSSPLCATVHPRSVPQNARSGCTLGTFGPTDRPMMCGGDATCASIARDASNDESSRAVVSPRTISTRARQRQHALGQDVALDLRGPCEQGRGAVVEVGACQPAARDGVGPRLPAQAARSEHLHQRVVHALAHLAPEELDEARLGTERQPPLQPAERAPVVEAGD